MFPAKHLRIRKDVTISFTDRLLIPAIPGQQILAFSPHRSISATGPMTITAGAEIPDVRTFSAIFSRHPRTICVSPSNPPWITATGVFGNLPCSIRPSAISLKFVSPMRKTNVPFRAARVSISSGSPSSPAAPWPVTT